MDDFIVCQKCGEQNPKTNNFCSRCANKLHKKKTSVFSVVALIVVFVLFLLLLYVMIRAINGAGAAVGSYSKFVGGNTATETPIPTNIPLSLQSVIAFNGNSTKTTETFIINSDKWRISWNTTPGKYGDANFQIFLYSSNGTLSGVCANVIGKNTDASYVYTHGTFYLVINTSQDYEIKIDEYK